MKNPAAKKRAWMAALAALSLSLSAFSLIIQPSDDNYGVARFVSTQPDHQSGVLPFQIGQ